MISKRNSFAQIRLFAVVTRRCISRAVNSFVDAAERFCKEMLVKEKRAKGDGTASVNDYDKKNLGHLGPLVEPRLTHDASHPGKLRALSGALNPAKHDDAVPAAGILKVALGDLRFLKKTYL
jgi:hypothetical protein